MDVDSDGDEPSLDERRLMESLAENLGDGVPCPTIAGWIYTSEPTNVNRK